jgi:hypothetical protein
MECREEEDAKYRVIVCHSGPKYWVSSRLCNRTFAGFGMFSQPYFGGVKSKNCTTLIGINIGFRAAYATALSKFGMFSQPYFGGVKSKNCTHQWEGVGTIAVLPVIPSLLRGESALSH